MQFFSLLHSAIPVLATFPTYSILGSSQSESEETRRLWETVKSVALKIFLTCLFCVSLYTNPNIFFLGANIGFIFARQIDEHVVKKIVEIWNNANLAEQTMMVLISSYLEFHLLWPTMALYSSIYLCSRFALARTSHVPPVIGGEVATAI